MAAPKHNATQQTGRYPVEVPSQADSPVRLMPPLLERVTEIENESAESRDQNAKRFACLEERVRHLEIAIFGDAPKEF